MVSKKIILILVAFSLIFLLRVFQIGGLSSVKYQVESDPASNFFQDIRQSIASQISDILPQPQAALLTGMTIGEKSDLPKWFKQALSATSTIHIVVVSGQNLTLLAGFIMSLVGLLGRKKTIIFASGIALFYCLLTGLDVPVLRAFLMVFLGFSAQLFNRQGNSFWILILVGSLMLIYNPNWLLSISFQLSFLATIGVLVVAPEIVKRLNFIPEFIKQDLAISLAAQLITLPIIAANFHTVSLVGVMANLLVLWTVPLIMISGSVILFVIFFSLEIARYLVIVPGVLLTYFVYVVSFLNQDWASLKIDDLPMVVWIGYYSIFFGLFLWLLESNKRYQVSQEISV